MDQEDVSHTGAQKCKWTLSLQPVCPMMHTFLPLVAGVSFDVTCTLLHAQTYLSTCDCLPLVACVSSVDRISPACVHVSLYICLSTFKCDDFVFDVNMHGFACTQVSLYRFPFPAPSHRLPPTRLPWKARGSDPNHTASSA